MTVAMTFLSALALCLALITPAQAQSSEWEMLNQEFTSLYRQGQFAKATVVAKKALSVAEAALGPNHPNVATSLNNLAELFRAQGQYAAAEPLYQRALAIVEKALGPDHPSVATSLNNLALLYEKTNRQKEADAARARAAKIQAIKR